MNYFEIEGECVRMIQTSYSNFTQRCKIMQSFQNQWRWNRVSDRGTKLKFSLFALCRDFSHKHTKLWTYWRWTDSRNLPQDLVNYDKISVYHIGSLRNWNGTAYLHNALHWTNNPVNNLEFGLIIKSNFVKMEDIIHFVGPLIRCGSRIWLRGAASEAESCQCSEGESCEWSEPLATGVQGLLKGPESFWLFNAQICFLLHSRDYFSLILTASSTPEIVHYNVFYIFIKIVSLNVWLKDVCQAKQG